MTLDLLDRRLLFVTGKGGVGKSTVTAGLALLAAERGKRTLVCEVDAKGNLADFFETSRPGFSPRQVQPGLFAMAMHPEESLQEYLRLQLHIPAITRIGPLAKAFDFVATAAPGVREILTEGKLAWEVRERHFQLVVADAAASGHIVGQLTAPQAINQLVKVGQVRHQTGWVADMLGDRATTGLVIVTTPEEMPVSETLDLLGRLERETGVTPSAVIANRVLPALFDRKESDLVAQLDRVEDLLIDAAGAGVRQVVVAAQLTEARRGVGAQHLERLRDELSTSLPVLYVPELFTRATGRRVVALVAEALGQELDVQ